MIAAKFKLFLLVIFIKKIECLFDPLTISAAVGLGALGYNYDFVKSQTYCRFAECCNSNWIPGDSFQLNRFLENDVFGQHIVQQHLVPAIRAHFNTYTIPKKPLVISFHGTPGIGKTFVSQKIAEALYAKGLKSNYVHFYLGRGEFPIDSEIKNYQSKLFREVIEKIKQCPRSMFVFDEVEKMPKGIFESLTSLANHNNHAQGTDYNFAIFILLSNTGGVEISNKLAELNKSGVLRENTELGHFEKILTSVSYNIIGGLEKSSLIESYVIDHYIPFLPLEKKHVFKCIIAEFNRWNALATKKDVENLISSVITFDPHFGLFATSGCKKLEKKVAVLVAQRKLH